MGSLTSVSRSQLARRRRFLRHQRRRKFFQTAWQILTISSLTGGILWATTRPDWFIYQPEEVVISGNQFLSDQAIQSLLPISYPSSILQLRPQALAETLESTRPIAQANVIRKLFPPGLIVEVQEKYPVAIAQVPSLPASDATSKQSNNRGLETKPLHPLPHIGVNVELGLLDENGVWMAEERYINLNQFTNLPSLTVIGDPNQYRPYWSQVYQAIAQSPIEVYEIDWRDPANLILKTELGIVHCGGQTDRISEQLRVLDRMRNLPDQVNASQIAYIDLTNPNQPTIQKTP
jgi:cell division protein FtsQ